MLSPSPYLGAPSTTAGQAQGPGEAMDTEVAGQAPEASAVTTGASTGASVPHLSKSEVSGLADRAWP